MHSHMPNHSLFIFLSSFHCFSFFFPYSDTLSLPRSNPCFFPTEWVSAVTHWQGRWLQWGIMGKKGTWQNRAHDRSALLQGRRQSLHRLVWYILLSPWQLLVYSSDTPWTHSLDSPHRPHREAHQAELPYADEQIIMRGVIEALYDACRSSLR